MSLCPVNTVYRRGFVCESVVIAITSPHLSPWPFPNANNVLAFAEAEAGFAADAPSACQLDASRLVTWTNVYCIWLRSLDGKLACIQRASYVRGGLKESINKGFAFEILQL